MGEPLPDLLRGLFWDQDFTALRWPEHAEAVTSRVLSSGESAELRWLRERVTDDELRAFLRARRGRGLERRQVAYWALVLDLPDEEVAGWLRAPERRVWDERTSRETSRDGPESQAPLERMQGFHARLAALEDLAAMKLAAVGQRGTRRDFVDVHALARSFRPLSDMLDLYRRKYAVEGVAHALYALAWFDEAVSP